KNLFDTNIMNEIIKAPDNNERYSLIERLKNDVLPHYDDIKTELPDIYEKLASVWLKTETTPIIPHETPYGNYAGKTPSQVTKIIVEIFERYKYLNIEKLYAIVRNLYLVNKGQDSKLQLCELIANLAKYNIHILNKYGIFVQLELLSLVSKETGNELANLAPLLSKILGEIVKPDVSGTTNTSDTVTFHSGHVPINEEIIKLRKKSIKLLGAYTKMIADDKDKRVNLVLLTNAFRMPQVANYSDDVAVMIMSDAVDVIQLFAEIAGNSNFELKQYLEAELFRIYCNYQTLPKQIKENAKIVEIRKKLLLAIEDARAVFEADEEYIIYKTLVGYESVFSLTWDRGTFDYKADKEFRESESQRYADNINRSNWKKWIVRLEQCAATQSNDHATFPPLIDFVNRVAKSKPELVLELLQNYSASLERLVPSIIFHLLIGNLRYEVITILNSWINEGRDVENIAYAHRLLEKPDKDLVKSLVKRVLADKNETAALALMESAVRRYKELPEFWKNEVFFPCLELLRNKKNLNWVHATWFIARGNSLFSQLNLEESKTVLSALIPVASVEYEVEFILVAIASNHANLVLDWFGERLLFSREDIDYHYEAIPFSLTHLRDHLTADPAVIINKIHGWLVKAPRNYEFHVNRFLSKLYSKFDDGLERELLLYIEGADVEKILFITKILTGFEGKPFLNSICKVAISNSLCDEIVRRQVSSIILETGVLSGEYGFAEARAEKKRQLSDWLTDEDKNIKDFAKNLFHRMDLEIASDRRRAEEQIALRKLEYGEDIVSKNE
ncbi:MAG: hypothetical protein L3J15_03505, partial [Devosiaceae bacterium]|nr:hypothetical protein [Devosiaceae bacterium]